MTQLSQLGRYESAFNNAVHAQVHQANLPKCTSIPAHPALIQHIPYNPATPLGSTDGNPVARYGHFADYTPHQYRDVHSLAPAMDEARMYNRPPSGLQPAFELYPAGTAWPHAVQQVGPALAGEDFEAGWHAGHYSSPTHYLSQELYADMPHNADGFEHPTLLRPAELVNSHGMVEQVMPVDIVQSEIALDEPQLIASDASAIPPPLPIEKSAHPLAALATDLVWEAFLAAANCNSPASSTHSQFASVVNSERSPSSGRSKAGSSPATSRYSLRSSVSPTAELHKRNLSKSSSPYVMTWNRSRSASAAPEADSAASANVYGAIGGERKPRRSMDSSPGSNSSSPASTAPGTPAMDAWMLAENLHNNGRVGVQAYWNDEDTHHDGKQVLPPISSILRPAVPQRFGSVKPPRALFDQIQKLLSATLLSQQVLLLALYYVARVPHTSPLYPPATSQSALQSTSAPFKLLLAALVVANKVSPRLFTVPVNCLHSAFA